MNIKKNITLIVGIGIPLLMIVLVAAAIYLPRLFIDPEFDFLYAYAGDHYARQEYGVQNGRLFKKVVDRQGDTPGETKFFIHDVSANRSKEISLAEAQGLELDGSPKSPDGFEIESGGSSSGGGFFPFFGSSRDYDSFYIVGRGTSMKLDLEPVPTFSYPNFSFLGWVR